MTEIGIIEAVLEGKKVARKYAEDQIAVFAGQIESTDKAIARLESHLKDGSNVDDIILEMIEGKRVANQYAEGKVSEFVEQIESTNKAIEGLENDLSEMTAA